MISTYDLSSKKIEEFFKRTFSLEKRKSKPVLDGVVGLLAFFEPSTRTRLSFEKAGLDLGIRWASLSPSELSLQKGESLRDTFEVIAKNQFDVIVVRHPDEGFPWLVERWTKAIVINAGDGRHEHPSQGLLDGYTLWKKFGRKKLQISIFGDAVNSRVARSSIRVFKALGHRISIVDDGNSLTALFARAFQVELCSRESLQEADVVMALRVQNERGGTMNMPPLEIRDLGQKTWLMHPGPVIPFQDLMPETLIRFDRSFISDQVQNGLFIRKQIFLDLLSKGKRRR